MGDPKGEYQIDMGLKDKDTGEFAGLLEVDVYTQMDPDWPGNYKFIHGLLRKQKYLIHPEPTISVTMNLQADKIVFITKEKMLKTLKYLLKLNL